MNDRGSGKNEELPVASAILDRDSHSANNGVVESGGLLLFELHMNNVGMMSGLFALIAVTVVCMILCLHGQLLEC